MRFDGWKGSQSPAQDSGKVWGRWQLDEGKMLIDLLGNGHYAHSEYSFPNRNKKLFSWADELEKLRAAA